VRPALRVTLVSLSCLGVLVSPACAATFKVDPSKSSLVVQIFREGVAARLGHDHVIQATTFSGRVTYDATAPAASSIRVQVHTATLKADDPATRQKFHLRGEPTAADVAEIEKSMKAESQPHVAEFPMITFISTAITAETENRYVVTGQLTIRGVTKAVRFPVNVAME
jgi:polyisoprenoid-binding protein YceI